MEKRDIKKPRGILHSRAEAQRFRHARLFPSATLAPWVEHFWIVRWDLRGRPPFVAETLPHPSVHVTIEARRAAVGGVHTGKFTRRLRGCGRVFGIKFLPAAFHGFLGGPLWRITNRTLPLRAIFGAAGDELVRHVRAEPDDDARCAELADAFLRARLPARDATAARVGELVARLATDCEIVRVDQLAALARLDVRALQKLFRTYVGVSPKWVIQRYRLHEAAEQLAAGGTVAMTELALRLGYFDQAHFIRDFKAIVGRTPGDYAARARRSRITSADTSRGS